MMSLDVTPLSRLSLATLLVMSLAACETFDFPGVHRIVVPQGNVYDEEMIEKLEVGMSRSQVRFIMGTPLIQDSFNPDRWDYAYRLHRGNEVFVQKKMTLFFEGDKLSRIDDVDAQDASETEAAES